MFLSARGAGASGCSTTFATPALSLLSEPTSLKCLNSPATRKGKGYSSIHGELRVEYTDNQRATRHEHSRPRAAKGATVPALHPAPAHPEPILKWAHSAHLFILDAAGGNQCGDFMASLEHMHFVCASRRRLSCHVSLVRRARCGIRWSALTQRRAALRAGGPNFGPSLSYKVGLGQPEPPRAQLQNAASYAWRAR